MAGKKKTLRKKAEQDRKFAAKRAYKKNNMVPDGGAGLSDKKAIRTSQRVTDDSNNQAPRIDYNSRISQRNPLELALLDNYNRDGIVVGSGGIANYLVAQVPNTNRVIEGDLTSGKRFGYFMIGEGFDPKSLGLSLGRITTYDWDNQAPVDLRNILKRWEKDSVESLIESELAKLKGTNDTKIPTSDLLILYDNGSYLVTGSNTEEVRACETKLSNIRNQVGTFSDGRSFCTFYGEITSPGKIAEKLKLNPDQVIYYEPQLINNHNYFFINSVGKNTTATIKAQDYVSSLRTANN